MPSRISAGRFINCDQDIKFELESCGVAGYDFILPHVAHPRCCLKADNLPETLPPFSKSDLLLTSHEWSRLVVASISPWIDVDAQDDRLRTLSIKALNDELTYFSYLSLPVIAVELKQAPKPNLQRIIAEFVESAGGPVVWVIVPMVNEKNATLSVLENGGQTNGATDLTGNGTLDSNSSTDSENSTSAPETDPDDTWHWFYHLRTACDNKARIGLCLKIATDMPSNKLVLKRWIGESIKSFMVDTRQFITNSSGFPVLTKAHQDFLQSLFVLNVQPLIVGPTMHQKVKAPKSLTLTDNGSNGASSATSPVSSHISCPYLGYLNHLFKTRPQDAVDDFATGYEDCLQVPLQPLGDHLEAQIYETFEKDPIKYREYKRATALAIKEVSKRRRQANCDTIEMNDTVVMVLGAGRGPLVTATIEALQETSCSQQTRVFAVEKNPSAIVTLNHLNATKWNGKVTIIESDMRDFRPKESDKADIAISELLGSFGDNELSPECLDGAIHLMKPDCINIPASYTSYLTPVHSPKLCHTVRQQWSKEHHPMAAFESNYVVRVLNHFLPSNIQPLFTFKHPNWELSSNDRYKELKFKIQQTCDITGFIGYFEADLFNDVNLSIMPETHTPGLFSWFPIMFPLKEPIYLKKDEELVLNFWRRSNARQVWYEWCLRSPIQTPIMNIKGRSTFIKKI